MVSVNKFRANLKRYADQAIHDHVPVEVQRQNGEAFVVISMEDYRREQETLYVLSNPSLMEQLHESMATIKAQTGFRPDDNSLGFE